MPVVVGMSAGEPARGRWGQHIRVPLRKYVVRTRLAEAMCCGPEPPGCASRRRVKMAASCTSTEGCCWGMRAIKRSLHTELKLGLVDCVVLIETDLNI